MSRNKRRDKAGTDEKIKNLKLGFTTFQPLLSDHGGTGIKMMTHGSSLERCTLDSHILASL